MTAVEDRLKSLMLRGLDGDAAAQRELLSELARLLRRYYARRLGDETADLEDLVQETLIAVHVRRASYDRAQPFTAWAYAMARYKLIDHYRRRRTRRAVPLEDAGALFAPEDTEAATAGADVDRLLGELPPKQQEAIRLTRLEGLSVAEAAERSGQSESSVKVGVHRGLKTLMARLRGDGS
ncbi:sigma-70 family RNA polymerase sigma factor [Phenylobacterium sp.]|uniref:sigma-70 family RNA polymerase sigma factor n=1 Tax=Phenylobacterium sp. TaxID=1871053 RepID=UPI0035B19969